MPKGIYMVFTECTDPDREEEFNRWYSHTHLPDLSAAKGYVRSRRFFNLRPEGGPSKYLALYEYESDDIEGAVADQRRVAMQTVADGRHLDFLRRVEGYVFQEIDAVDYEPLESLDYPRTRPGS